MSILFTKHPGPGHEENAASQITPLEAESADYFASFAQMMGLTRSVGQIYGLLFMSEHPLPMEQVIEKLEISKGSASQGLNVLKVLGALRTLRPDGERRDYFEADLNVTRMVTHFLEERLEPRLQNAEARLQGMSLRIQELPEHADFRNLAQQRLDALARWQKRGKGVLPLIRRFFRR